MGLFFLTGCMNSEVEKSLLEPGSTWLLSTNDVLNPGKEKTILFQFEDNGYVNEVHTILYFPWKYSDAQKFFKIDRYEYKVLEVKKDTIFMLNVDSGVPSRLIRQK